MRKPETLKSDDEKLISNTEETHETEIPGLEIAPENQDVLKEEIPSPSDIWEFFATNKQVHKRYK